MAWKSRPPAAPALSSSPLAPHCSADAPGTPAQGHCPGRLYGALSLLSLQPVFRCYPLPPHYLIPQAQHSDPPCLSLVFRSIYLLGRYTIHLTYYIFVCLSTQKVSSMKAEFGTFLSFFFLVCLRTDLSAPLRTAPGMWQVFRKYLPSELTNCTAFPQSRSTGPRPTGGRTLLRR